MILSVKRLRAEELEREHTGSVQLSKVVTIKEKTILLATFFLFGQQTALIVDIMGGGRPRWAKAREIGATYILFGFALHNLHVWWYGEGNDPPCRCGTRWLHIVKAWEVTTHTTWPTWTAAFEFHDVYNTWASSRGRFPIVHEPHGTL